MEGREHINDDAREQTLRSQSTKMLLETINLVAIAKPLACKAKNKRTKMVLILYFLVFMPYENLSNWESNSK